MAIQHRRGVFNQFDPTNLLPGEWAVVLSGDTSTDDGKAAYICFAAGTVKRVATYEDMVENISNATEDVVAIVTDEYTAELVAATTRANTAAATAEAGETARTTAETARATAESGRVTAEQGRVTAEQGRVTAENGRVTAETQRVTRFAEMEQLAHGWIIHHCTSSEYDATTRKPTVSDPDTSTLYCVPNTGTSGDAWTEWRYDSESHDFEPVGSATANTSPITTSTIDSIVADTAETGTEVLQTTGLTYLWTKLKAAFSAAVHYHTSLGSSSTTVLSVDATKRSVAEGQNCTASGNASHAEGNGSTASADLAHAEGYQSTASNVYAHAEGYMSTASNDSAHAEGKYSTASGLVSHAEGYGTTAGGQYSHAQNRDTKASSDNQTALGKYNVEDSNSAYSVIVGNGTANNARSDAMTLDWNGNAALGAVNHGTSATAAATAEKAVSAGAGFNKNDGARLTVGFTYANTADAPTLNVNSKGATAIYVNGSAASSTNPLKWDAGDILEFYYDGTYWNYVGKADAEKLDVSEYHKAYTWGEAKQAFTWGSIRGSSSTTGNTTTTNLGLTKPGYNASLDIATINSDLDTLDAVIGDTDVSTDGSLQSQIDSLQSSVSHTFGSASQIVYFNGFGNGTSISIEAAYSDSKMRIGYYNGSSWRHTAWM